MTREKGFIQLEIIISLFIIGILLTVSIPSFSKMQNRLTLENWINQFLVDYYWAQQEAVSSDKWVEIVFNSDNHYYLLRNERGIIKNVKYDSNIQIKENLLNHRIMFNAVGRLARRNGTIDVFGPSGEKHLIIQLITGQIHVEG